MTFAVGLVVTPFILDIEDLTFNKYIATGFVHLRTLQAKGSEFCTFRKLIAPDI